jgi:hypothetical protein
MFSRIRRVSRVSIVSRVNIVSTISINSIVITSSVERPSLQDTTGPHPLHVSSFSQLQ